MDMSRNAEVALELLERAMGIEQEGRKWLSLMG